MSEKASQVRQMQYAQEVAFFLTFIANRSVDDSEEAASTMFLFAFVFNIF
jgi:hypothetical protein